METRVEPAGVDLPEAVLEGIERDLEKVRRRLKDREGAALEVRITSRDDRTPGFETVMELSYGRKHLIARGQDTEARSAVKQAREDLLRQINDRSRRGHSSYVKESHYTGP